MKNTPHFRYTVALSLVILSISFFILSNERQGNTENNEFRYRAKVDVISESEELAIYVEQLIKRELRKYDDIEVVNINPDAIIEIAVTKTDCGYSHITPSYVLFYSIKTPLDIETLKTFSQVMITGDNVTTSTNSDKMNKLLDAYKNYTKETFISFGAYHSREAIQEYIISCVSQFDYYKVEKERENQKAINDIVEIYKSIQKELEESENQN